MSRSALTGTVLALMAASVKAHGHVQLVIADGVEYPGAVPYNWADDSVGWVAQNLDNGFVEPSAFSDPDIVCHRDATPPSNAAVVAAGGSVTLQWNTWPESHHGPVIDYLAAYSEGADKTSLSFAKIAETGLVSGSNPGVWGSDELMANGNSWTVEIPSDTAPGLYVLRHEIIALHSGSQPNGAQAYPQCINIEVTGGGSTVPSGEPATSFYTADDEGILFNIYGTFDSYPVPGPALS
ncbi:hypothetical protein S40293_05616 [Stachybotrys chartarum IBT 40293]|nr:hypothetical protein S40293_05616 [Stachybotrys chartarum IBT 40293]KFA72559.1 hypothetical protein S40288_06856 [Stachybotrys chartarum IBT 40288]